MLMILKPERVGGGKEYIFEQCPSDYVNNIHEKWPKVYVVLIKKFTGIS